MLAVGTLTQKKPRDIAEAFSSEEQVYEQLLSNENRANPMESS